MTQPVPPDHLGDGVYATDTGHSLVLTTGDHREGWANNVVHIDPHTLAALERYIARMKQARQPPPPPSRRRPGVCADCGGECSTAEQVCEECGR